MNLSNTFKNFRGKSNRDDRHSLADQGQLGCTTLIEGGAATATGTYSRIQILTDTVFNTITDAMDDGDVLTEYAVPAGIVLYGEFSNITLTSGLIRCYR